MILTYVRSSSHSTHKLCPFSYYLQYQLGFRPPSGIAADRGSIVHKALEILARIKLLQQEGKTEFHDDELLGGYVLPVTVDDDAAIELAWRHYTEGPASHHRWTDKDYVECDRLFRIALTHSGGAFNPRNRTVIQPEQYFDISLSEYPWASYQYDLPDGQTLRGSLALKGTVDLILEGDDGHTLEYVDWKTGRLVDWGTGRVKTINDLYNDFQLRLYHLALSRLYPDRDILMTVFYIKDGGPFSLAFERSEVPETLRIIRLWFESVRDAQVPERKIGFPCRTFCPFGKTLWRDQRFVPPGTDQHGDHLSICDHVHGEVQQLGIDRVMAKYGDLKSVGAYGSGGGVQNRV